jgi:tRNA U34 2-thiouridine synthase MnmA/TrmU
MFPLGAYRKAEVRALARQFALPVADKSDSQDICFVPQGRYTDIIERLKPGAAQAGDIVHVDGRVLGRHGGIINYTIGQRRGLGIPGPAPLYVVRLDADAKQVVVGPRESLHAHWITLRNVNWLGMVRSPKGAWTLPCACAPLRRQRPRPCCRRQMALGCCCATGNMGWLRARLASCTPMPVRRRGCWAAAGSGAP